MDESGMNARTRRIQRRLVNPDSPEADKAAFQWDEGGYQLDVLVFGTWHQSDWHDTAGDCWREINALLDNQKRLNGESTEATEKPGRRN